MRYLISGGLGFIPSNFIEYLYEVDLDCQVINIDNMSIGSSINNTMNFCNNVRYRLIKGSITQINQINIPDIDYIVNFAAESHVDRSIASSIPFTETNTLGAHLMMDYAISRKVPLLQVSTDEVYGEILGDPVDETAKLQPGNPYAASKAAADLMALSYIRTYGSDFPGIKITRSCNNYGPNQFPEKLIPLVIKNLMEGKKVPIYGDGSQVREWIYVKDNCRAIYNVLTKGKSGEIYNIGTKQRYSNLMIVDLILEEMGLGREMVEFVEDRKGHDARYALDSTKVEGLGKYIQMDMKQGIRDTIRHYKERGFTPW